MSSPLLTFFKKLLLFINFFGDEIKFKKFRKLFGPEIYQFQKIYVVLYNKKLNLQKSSEK